MSRTRKYRYFVGDFETTVYPGQKSTEVWASAFVELYTDNAVVLHSIDESFAYLKSLKSNIVCYYHNLKFDGEFWMYYFLYDLNFAQASYQIGNEDTDIAFYKESKMKNNTFLYHISDMGKWYSFFIKVNDYIIEFRDSLKLLPFSVKQIGKSFGTKHKKLDIDYIGFRYAGCPISEKEEKYIKNDVYVVKEALEILFDEGHNKLTIGACCLSEYKSIVGKDFYKTYFVDLTQVIIQSKFHIYENADEWIRKTYKGGWCYLVPEKANKIINHGITADVNSLYPSMMHSESGSRYPVGMPKFWTGNRIPDDALQDDIYYFIHVKTRFYIKDNYLPFIQIKGNFLYKSTDILESSDIKDKKSGLSSPYIINENGEEELYIPDLYFTMTEYILFLEHYNVIDFEIIDGCYFESVVGIFDEYIDKYKKIKMESTGAKRTEAKLFLNNLYGKMASSTDSSFKYAYKKEDDTVGYFGITANDKTPGYIAIGSAITGYARNFTIRHAQKNYHGKDKPGFIYADTDSIHCDLSESDLIDIKTHPTNFNCWSIESTWDEAIFVRAKTYIEYVTSAEDPYYDIKCAGMPDSCKIQFEKSMTGLKEDDKQWFEKLNEEQKKFVETKRGLKDFKYGLKIFGKLVPKRIKGGVVLNESYYELRKWG